MPHRPLTRAAKVVAPKFVTKVRHDGPRGGRFHSVAGVHALISHRLVPFAQLCGGTAGRQAISSCAVLVFTPSVAHVSCRGNIGPAVSICHAIATTSHLHDAIARATAAHTSSVTVAQVHVGFPATARPLHLSGPPNGTIGYLASNALGVRIRDCCVRVRVHDRHFAPHAASSVTRSPHACFSRAAHIIPHTRTIPPARGGRPAADVPLARAVPGDRGAQKAAGAPLGFARLPRLEPPPYSG